MSLNFNNFFILYIIAFFFNDLRIRLFLKSWTTPMSVAFILIGLAILLLSKKKSFINFSLETIFNRKNSLNVYLYFVLYILFITLIFGIIQKTSIFISFAEIIFTYILAIFSIFLITSYIICKLFTPYKVIKIMYGTFYFVLIVGIIDFIIYKFNIVPLQYIHSLFFNIQSVAAGGMFYKPIAFGIPRVQSVYYEPGIYGQYLFIFSPLLYTLALSKYKIFKKKYIDKIIKKTTIPLLWLNLIMTQSPIWLVFTLVSTLIYFSRKILNFMKKYIKQLIVSAFLILTFSTVFISKVNINDTYLSRIVTVISNIKNINVLIMAEQSLGTRISCVLNLLDIGSRTPIFGAGHTNLKPLMVDQICNYKSKIAVTAEMYTMICKRETPMFQNPPLSNMFLRYGLIGLILYYFFLFKTFIQLKKSIKYAEPILKNICNAFLGIISSIFIVSCYDMSIINLFLYFLISIIIGLIQYIQINYFKVRTIRK